MLLSFHLKRVEVRNVTEEMSVNFRMYKNIKFHFFFILLFTSERTNTTERYKKINKCNIFKGLIKDR